MVGKHHVLLIGIDAYQGGNSLNGCVNDIDAIQRILIDRQNIAPAQIVRLAAPRSGTKHPTDVSEKLPTRENILVALKALGSDKVAASDRVLIYYSGHGTQLQIIAPSGDRFSREALVPSDHIVFDETRYVFDWELNQLLAAIAERTTRVSVVLDACCSAGATRGDLFTPEGGSARMLKVNEDYVLPADIALPEAMEERGLIGGRVRSVQACQVVTACQDDELARESAGTTPGDIHHGELTRALIRQLQRVPANELSELPWGRIWAPMVGDIAAINPAQHPWMSGRLARQVLGGPLVEADTGFGVTQGQGAYQLQAGSLLDVTKDALVAVYGPTPAIFPERESPEDLAARKGLLLVKSAERATAKAEAVGAPFPLPEGARSRLVKMGLNAELLVALAPRDQALIDKLNASSLVKVAPAGVAGDITLVKRADGVWVVTDDVFGDGTKPEQPVLIAIPPESLKRARAVVEHYRDYIAPLRLAKRCVDLPGSLRVEILDCKGQKLTAETAQTASLPVIPPGKLANYDLKDGGEICFRVENGSSLPLHVALLDCQSDGSVFLLGSAVLVAHSKHLFFLDEALGQPFPVSVPDGQGVAVDRVVALGTTNRSFDFSVLVQDATFAAVLKGIDRNLKPPPDGAERWTSAVTSLRITK